MAQKKYIFNELINEKGWKMCIIQTVFGTKRLAPTISSFFVTFFFAPFHTPKMTRFWTASIQLLCLFSLSFFASVIFVFTLFHLLLNSLFYYYLLPYFFPNFHHFCVACDHLFSFIFTPLFTDAARVYIFLH